MLSAAAAGLSVAGEMVGERESKVQSQPAAIAVDYPPEGSFFPPDISPPAFLWRDPAGSAAVWVIEVAFGDRSRPIQVKSGGERMRPGEIDPTCVGAEPPKLTPEQEAAHTWIPDAATWAEIKKRSGKRPAVVTITGYRGEVAVSRGRVTIRTAKEPVGAPIFFRDVPLIPVPTERGVIKPLPDFAMPLIKWSLRSVSETRSRTMMEGLPTCANCHSFSRDGKWIGLDVDGPQNDKGLYGLVHLDKHTSIRDQDVIRWNSFTDVPANKRFGFMSQVSPDGTYVVTTIGHPGGRVGGGIDDRFYNASYTDYRFGQVFYPTRGVLAWYSRETKKLQPLPGADDPKYVQSNAVWSPDGKYLVFIRADARIRITTCSSPRNTRMTRRRRRSSTTSTGFRSTRAKAARRSASRARHRTERATTFRRSLPTANGSFLSSARTGC